MYSTEVIQRLPVSFHIGFYNLFILLFSTILLIAIELLCDFEWGLLWFVSSLPLVGTVINILLRSFCFSLNLQKFNRFTWTLPWKLQESFTVWQLCATGTVRTRDEKCLEVQSWDLHHYTSCLEYSFCATHEN